MIFWFDEIYYYILFSRFFFLIVAQTSSNYSALFHLGMKRKLIEFRDFDSMLSKLHEHWPVLKAKHNLVVSHKNFKDSQITDDQSLRTMFVTLGNTAGIHLHVDMNSHGYSWYAKQHWEGFIALNFLYTGLLRLMRGSLMNSMIMQ